MKWLSCALVFAFLLAGCGKKEELPGGVLAAAPMAAASADRAVKSYLAYQHAVYVEAPEEKVAQVFAAVQSACREAAAGQCEILESNLRTGKRVSASLKLRAAAADIPKLVGILHKNGEVVSQSTTAEDLAAPIADVDTKLAMLKDYRHKLEALRERAQSDVDALIKVNKELAQVQTELEEGAGQRAHLMKRVETQILNVSIDAAGNAAFWRPIGDAAGDFGGNLAQGISSAITGVAYLLPWALILSGLVWLVRKLIRRWKRV